MANLGLQNNNAGNLRDPATGNFKVFKDMSQGYKALVDDLEYKKSGQSSHIKPGGTILDLANVWAPASDNNIPANWANNVAKTVGVKPNSPWADIPTDQLAKGIQVAEGTSTPNMNTQTQSNNTQSTNKMSVEDFGKLIQSKYPEYQGKDPKIVGQKTLDKYPQYQDKVQGYTPTSKTPQFGFTSQGDVQQEQPNADLQSKSWYDLGGNGAFDRPLAPAEGAGYALSNLMGTQDKNIEAQNQGADVQANLIKKIKENKAAGRDTSRLQKALTDLTGNLQKSGNSISDVGTGGITSNQIKVGAAELAAPAVATYAAGALGGGGLFNTARGLASGQLGSVVPKALSALTNPTIKPVIEGLLGKGETLSNLSRQDLITGLGNYLKEMSSTDIGGSTEQAVLKALKALEPTVTKAPGLISKGIDFAGKYALTKALGDTIGGAIHGILPK